MSIIRTKSPHRFTIVSNELLAESNPMSWEATGLLIYLLSKPDNWQVSIAALTNIGKCGKNKIESILKELKRLGYVVGKRHSSGKYNYYVYDTPQTPQSNPKPENQVEAKKPKPENPVQAFPEQDFQSLINTDIKINTENNNNNKTDNQPAQAVHVNELLLSLDLKVKESETIKKVSQSEEKAERQKEIVNTPISSLAGLSERQLKNANKELAKLAPDQRNLAIDTFNNMAKRGEIKRNAMGLLENLIARGRNNELEPPVTSFSQNPAITPVFNEKTPVEANNEDSRKETLLEILKIKVAKHKNKMLTEFQEKRAVFIQGVGVIYKDDLTAAGLFD